MCHPVINCTVDFIKGTKQIFLIGTGGLFCQYQTYKWHMHIGKMVVIRTHACQGNFFRIPHGTAANRLQVLIAVD